MNDPIPKQTARQVLLMLKGVEGINIEADETYYPMREDVSIEHILERMGYEKENKSVKEEI